MQTNSISFSRSVASQVTAILIAALGAAAITFFQSLATASGACPLPVGDPAQAGALGAAIKSAHTAFIMNRGIL